MKIIDIYIDRGLSDQSRKAIWAEREDGSKIILRDSLLIDRFHHKLWRNKQGHIKGDKQIYEIVHGSVIYTKYGEREKILDPLGSGERIWVDGKVVCTLYDAETDIVGFHNWRFIPNAKYTKKGRHENERT